MDDEDRGSLASGPEKFRSLVRLGTWIIMGSPVPRIPSLHDGLAFNCSTQQPVRSIIFRFRLASVTSLLLIPIGCDHRNV
jgi:hypothetical protein